ncbi:MAG: hypothetical protein ACFHU9_14340 [Fluviicola sp.]
MKRIIIAAILVLGIYQLNAQEYSISEGATVEMEQQKDSEVRCFTSGGTHYFITSYFESPGFSYHMNSVASNGSNFQNKKLQISPGELGDVFTISDVVGLENQAYVLVNNQNSDKKMRTLSARKLSPDGTISASEIELMSFGYEKMLRVGRMITATSPDKKKFVTVGVLPFNKKESRKIQVSTFDADMNETSSSTFEVEGLAIKNARFEAVIANDGTVYINRFTSKLKEGTKILVHEYNPKSTSLENTYLVEAAEGNQMNDYMYATNENGELIIAAGYRKDTKLIAGDEEQTGVFIFRNEGKSNGVIEYNNLDAPIPNFELTGIHFGAETIYVTIEDTKSAKSSPAQTTPTTANTTYTFTHGNDYILGFNSSGKKMFELTLDLGMTARNTKHTLYGSAHIIDGALVYIFNDQFSKYRNNEDIASGGTIPVAITVDASGDMSRPVPFMNDLKMTNGFTLLPNYSAVDGNTCTLLARDKDILKVVQITVE